MATPKDKKEDMQNVTALGNMETGKREQNRKKLFDVYDKQEKVVVTVSPFYAPFLGSNVMISLQGISVYVPANGQPYKIPRSHAGLLMQSIAQIDAHQLRLNKMSNVQQNFEPSIGAMKI
jgi:hypothetical protein